MDCDWLLTRNVPRDGILVQEITGYCGAPAAVRYRQFEHQSWLGRCAGVHADALSRDVVEVQVIERW